MVEKVLVDVNNADEQELTLIPGIGPKLARRIIDARPYASPDDVIRVQGINNIVLDRIKPYIALTPTPFELANFEQNEEPSVGTDDAFEEDEYLEEQIEDEDFRPEEVFNLLRGDVVEPLAPLPSDETVEESLELASPLIDEPDTLSPAAEPVGEEPLSEPVLEAQVFDTPEESDMPEEPLTHVVVTDTKYVTRGQFLWLGLLIMVLALAFGVALSLGILSGINGGLRYAVPEQVAEITQELAALSSRTVAIESTLDSMQTRLDNLEALSGRIDALETATGGLQEDVNILTTDVEVMDGLIQTLNDQTDALRVEMDTVSEQANRFQGVMDGLRDLLNNLFPTE